MFLNFQTLGNGLSEIEEDEKARVQAEGSYLRVLEAENLQDVEDVPTETLAEVMLNIHDFTSELCSASSVVGQLFSGTRRMKRVATARLL